MEVQVETPRPCEAKISFTVPSAEFESQVERGLKNVARRTRMKGFRPGKTPISVVAKQFGDQVRHETAQFFFNQALNQAMRDKELVPASQPRIEHEDLHAKEGEDFAREFEVLVRPTPELGEYKGLLAQTQKIDVSEEELDATLEDLRQRNARTEPVGDDGLPEGGMAIAKVTLEVDGETVLDRDGLRLAVDHPVAGADPEAWKEAMVGASKGAEISLPVTFPDDFEKEDVRGKDGTCRIEINEAFAVTPASDEEVFRLLEAESMDEARTKLSERIRDAKENQQRGQIETELLERVIEAHPMELPESLVEEQAKRQVESAREGLVEQGLGEEEIEAQLEAQYQAAYDTTARSMRAIYLMEAIAQKERLLVTDDDMVTELRQIARRNGAPFEEVRDYYQKENLVNQLGLELLERKVRTFLRENAEIQEAG